jgi:hypothetical protein
VGIIIGKVYGQVTINTFKSRLPCRDCISSGMARQIRTLESVNGCALLTTPDFKRVDALIKSRAVAAASPRAQPAAAVSSDSALATISEVLQVAVTSLNGLVAGVSPSEVVQQLSASVQSVINSARSALAASTETTPLIDLNDSSELPASVHDLLRTPRAEDHALSGDSADGLSAERLPEDPDACAEGSSTTADYTMVSPAAAANIANPQETSGGVGGNVNAGVPFVSPATVAMARRTSSSSQAAPVPAAASSAAASAPASADTPRNKRMSKGEKQVAAAEAQRRAAAGTDQGLGVSVGSAGSGASATGGSGASITPARRRTALERLVDSMNAPAPSAAVSPNTVRERLRKQREYGARIEKRNKELKAQRDALPRFRNSLVTPDMIAAAAGQQKGASVRGGAQAKGGAKSSSSSAGGSKDRSFGASV